MSAQASANKNTGAIRRAIGVRLVTLQDRLLDVAEAKAGQQWKDMLRSLDQMAEVVQDMRGDVKELL